MNRAPDAGAFRFRAFISYSHHDKAWADWLHRTLETYRVPSRLVGQRTGAGTVPRRLVPVFRDRDELATSGDLGHKIAEALTQSANLIVICSPAAARSRWVREEILAFRRLGRDERIFCLIVAGEPNAPAGGSAEECLSSALCHPLDPDGATGEDSIEPIAADLRPDKDGRHNAKLKLIAGLLGVEFDQLRRRELQRRNRRMAAVTALALAMMALTTTLAISALIARNAAVAASQDAARRQKQAEGLVNFMLGDLNDKLAQVSRLDIMEAVDDRAMAYFQSLPGTDVTDQALAQRAKALEKIGSVRLDQGHLSAAMASYESALKLAAPLADAAPEDTPRQLAYAEILAFIGMIHWRQGQLGAAQQAFTSAQGVLQRTQRYAAGDPDLQYQLAMIDNNVGHVSEARGRLEEATAQYRDTLALCERLAAAHPDSVEWTNALGFAHNNLGKLAVVRGDIAAAVTQYSASLGIASALAARDSRNNDQRESALNARIVLGETLALAGDLASGISDLQQSVTAASELNRVDPSNSAFQEDLAHGLSQLSRLKRLSGDLSTAKRMTAQSLVTYRALIRQDPANSGWQREFAEALVEQAEQFRSGGNVRAARTQAESALQILGPLLAKQPDDRNTLLATVQAKLLLAASINDAEAAQQLRTDSVKALQARTSGSNDPRLLALLVDALLTLGQKAQAQALVRQLWSSGYSDRALVMRLQKEGMSYPANALFQQRLLAATRGNTPSKPAQ